MRLFRTVKMFPFNHVFRSNYTFRTARQLRARKALRLAFAFKIQPYGYTRVQLACNMLRYTYYARTYGPIKSHDLGLRFTRLYALRMYGLRVLDPVHTSVPRYLAYRVTSGTLPVFVLYLQTSKRTEKA